MTTRIKTSLAAGVAALMLAGGAAAVLAATSAEAPAARQDQPQPQERQRRGPGGPGFGGPMRGGFGPEFRGLDITEDQRTQLRKIREARQSEFKAAGEKLRAAREGMRALIESESINESAIRSKAAEVGAAEAEVAILNAKVRQESMQVLTSEQQQKLKEFREQRGAQMKQRRGPRGQA